MSSHTVRVTIEVTVEAPNQAEAQEAAQTWGCAVLERIRPQCPTCRGRGRVRQGYDDVECWTCHGRRTYGEHPLRPRVVNTP